MPDRARTLCARGSALLPGLTVEPQEKLPETIYWPPSDGGGGRGSGNGRGGGGGGGDPGDPGGGSGAEDSGDERSQPESSKVRQLEAISFGVALWMAALLVTFLIVLLATWVLVTASPERIRLPHGLLPRLLWSTLWLGLSSLCVELARAQIKRLAPRKAQRWLHGALLFATGFLASQGLAFRALYQLGLRANTSSLCATFTTLAALHALHILGGLIYLLLAERRLARPHSQALAFFTISARYWHFLSLLWLAILFALQALL